MQHENISIRAETKLQELKNSTINRTDFFLFFFVNEKWYSMVQIKLLSTSKFTNCDIYMVVRKSCPPWKARNPIQKLLTNDHPWILYARSHQTLIITVIYAMNDKIPMESYKKKTLHRNDIWIFALVHFFLVTRMSN